jgi:type I site-specific restriction endonuclease
MLTQLPCISNCSKQNVFAVFYSWFKETRIKNLQTFADIFDIKDLEVVAPHSDTKLHISTFQAFGIFYPSDNTSISTVYPYDCIVVDGCYRGIYLIESLVISNNVGCITAMIMMVFFMTYLTFQIVGA